MTIKTIIFDWAGTTVDFGCMAPVDAFKKAFLEQGIQLTNEEIRQPMGKLKREHTEILLHLPSVQEQWLSHHLTLPTEQEIDQLYQRFEAILFEGLAENSMLKPETQAVISQLKAHGFNIGTTTGYTRQMMAIVSEAAAKNGYTPDLIVTPDDVAGLGRPFPYMIYKNMAYFKNRSVNEVVKIGDTIADIQEGQNAGIFTIAVIEGSSEMGLSLTEYQALPTSEKTALVQKTAAAFYEAGADLCILDLNELIDYFIIKEKSLQAQSL